MLCSRFAKFQKKAEVADFRQNLKAVKKDKYGVEALKADKGEVEESIL